jgi:anti-anti-sigma factor
MDVTSQIQWIERVLNTVSSYIYVYNASTHSNVYANRDMGDILGYSPEELRAMGSELLATIMHPDDFATQPTIIRRLMEAADGEVVEAEYRVRDHKGDWIWFQDRMTVFSRDEQGTMVEYIGAAQVVTERKEMEKHLQENQQRLQFALEGSGDGTWDWDLRRNEAVLSDRYREILGYLPDELPNSVDSWVSNIHPDDLPTVQQHLQEYLEGNRDSYAIEHRLRRKSGDWLWVLSRGKVIEHDENGAPLRMTGTISDIHERKQTEAERERALLQQQIIEAQRMTLRELSTPLIPITNDVVIMPLIGSIDTQRAQQIMETLLEGVARHQSELAILDITGVSVIDTQVAQALVRAAQAVKLLGVQVMLTGIQPQIAQMLVHLGVDLSGIQSQGSLQAGIAAALSGKDRQ